MKNLYFILIVSLAIGFSSCEVEEIPDPNNPTVEQFENGATLADLQLLAQGLEATIRNDMQFHFWTLNMVGREYLDLRGTDPRYTSELLGQNGGDLDKQGFLTTRTYFGRFRSVRNAILLKNAVANTAASLTAGETNAFLGFANTIIGYEMLLEATRQYENGIRTQVDDPNNLGPFAGSFQESLNGIKGYLDEGFTQLSSASDDFPFALSADGFSSIPGTQAEAMAQFNRGIAARVALYSGKRPDALTELSRSFMDLEGGMDMGAYYAYGGATGNDQTNPLFYIPNTDNDEAVAAINVVRDAAGIGDYTGDTDDASLVDEVLYQRRYSLWGEGHRWIDLRRYDRLDEIPLDRAGDKVHTQFPRPASEE